MTKRKIEYWVIPPDADGEFVANMEEVLETYEKAYDPDCPVVCMDEQPVQLIGETLTALEMRTLRDAEILHRLFNEDDVRLFEPAPVFFRCRCSRERVGGMLQSLGEAESRSVLAERGEVEVHCDFCNRGYIFDAVDIAQLFNPQVVSDRGSSVH